MKMSKISAPWKHYSSSITRRECSQIGSFNVNGRSARPEATCCFHWVIYLYKTKYSQQQQQHQQESTRIIKAKWPRSNNAAEKQRSMYIQYRRNAWKLFKRFALLAWTVRGEGRQGRRTESIWRRTVFGFLTLSRGTQPEHYLCRDAVNRREQLPSEDARSKLSRGKKMGNASRPPPSDLSSI